MTAISFLPMIGVGLITGLFAGVFGIGGGVVIVPMLVLIFKYSQPAAVGTSLVALLLPVGLLGAIEYYRSGKLSHDQIKVGLVIAIGLFFGTLIGAKIGIGLPQGGMQKAFSIFLALIAVKLWFSTIA